MKLEKIKFKKEEMEELKISEEDETWLDSLSADELMKYAGKYIAVREKKIVASATSLDHLYEELDKLRLGMVTIRMIEKTMMVVY